MTASEREVWAQEEAYWRFVKARDKQQFLGLWDERFAGWPYVNSAPIHKDALWQVFDGIKLLDYKLEPLSVREYGDSIVTTFYRLTLHSTDANGGNEQTAVSRLTHTWMKTGSGWQIVGGMSSLDTPAHTDQ